MSRQSWDDTWLAVAAAVARRSACGRASVGAVLVQANRVVATGYNGPAAGYPANTSTSCTEWCRRAASGSVQASVGYGFDCPSIHAEANALLYASRHDAEGATLYVTHAPCADCAKLISNSGVTHVVVARDREDHRPDSISYLTLCGLTVTVRSSNDTTA